MKIGILTFTDGTNIGQRLQNYALQTLIQREVNGAEVYTVCQKRSLENLKKFVRLLIGFIKNYSKQIKIIERNRKFNEFNKNYISFYSKKILYSAEKFDDSFDLFFAGSDQIWNPNSKIVNSNFFLEFAPYNKRRTYAPSFSVNDIPDNYIDKYKSYLNGFEKLSVREKRGQYIIDRLIQKEAELVLDPTLLLEAKDYNCLKKKCVSKVASKYVVLFTLGKDSEVEDVEKVFSDCEIIKIDNETVIGPSEFLDLISDAHCVVTDSYHVTVFSIIYKRNFYVINRKDQFGDMSSRFISLLSILNLENRAWSSELEMEDICFEEVEKELEKYKEKSISFLRDELNR